MIQVVALHLDAAGVAMLEYCSLQKSIQAVYRISHTSTSCTLENLTSLKHAYIVFGFFLNKNLSTHIHILGNFLKGYIFNKQFQE